MIKLTPEQKKNVKKWIDALESGKYKQGYVGLRTGRSKYCCLGVLCDVVGTKAGGRWKKEYYEIEEEYLVGYPPTAVMNLVNLTEYRVGKLVDLNDYEKASFHEIAKYLRKYYGMPAKTERKKK